MNRIGFPKSKMDEEYRIALLPKDIVKISNPDHLFFSAGYGKRYEIPDREYKEAGAKIVSSRHAYEFEVICQPKFCHEDVPYVIKNQILFGWLHLEEGRITKKIAKKGVTAITWENMYNQDVHVFKRNNILTGKIAVIDAIGHAGKVPEECKVAVIGRGMVGRGAIDQLAELGVVDLTVYHTGNISLLPDRLQEYDVIVHCSNARETILLAKQLKRMKLGALLIDIGSDVIDGPPSQSVYTPFTRINNGRNLRYCVNHVPTLAYKTATEYISEDVAPYIDILVKGELDDVLRNAMVIDKGQVLTDKL